MTEASFLAWYCATHNKKAAKRAIGSSSSSPSAKKQAVLPGAKAAAATAAAATATLTKGKRTALLKAVGSSLKASIKGKKTKW